MASAGAEGMGETCGLASCRVVLVDDDIDHLEALAELLREMGLEVEAFSSAVSALKYIELYNTKCLITDINMPEMNGYELAHFAQEIHKDILIILMTGDISNNKKIRSSWRYFVKPVDIFNMCDEIVQHNFYLKTTQGTANNVDLVGSGSSAKFEASSLNSEGNDSFNREHLRGRNIH